MTDAKEIGEVKKIPSIQQIEWSIPDFFTVAEDREYFFLVSSTFPVAGILWNFIFFPYEGQLFLTSEDCRKNSSFYLPSDSHREYFIEYDFGLKKCDGTIEHLVNGIVKKNESKNNSNFVFMKKAQLLQRKSELVPDNILTIICTIRWVTDVSQSNIPPKTVLDNRTKDLKLIRLDKLSESFKTFFADKETCDVTLTSLPPRPDISVRENPYLNCLRRIISLDKILFENAMD